MAPVPAGICAGMVFSAQALGDHFTLLHSPFGCLKIISLGNCIYKTNDQLPVLSGQVKSEACWDAGREEEGKDVMPRTGP